MTLSLLLYNCPSESATWIGVANSNDCGRVQICQTKNTPLSNSIRSSIQNYSAVNLAFYSGCQFESKLELNQQKLEA